MSGPALKKKESHAAIHEAALHEARELTVLLRRCVSENKKHQALQVAEIVIEHWESRTLQHAAAEEEGLYREIVQKWPSLKETVVQLSRDHHLLRRLVQKMKEHLVAEKIDETFVQMAESLIIVDELHNEDEERVLPEENESLSSKTTS